MTRANDPEIPVSYRELKELDPDAYRQAIDRAAATSLASSKPGEPFDINAACKVEAMAVEYALRAAKANTSAPPKAGEGYVYFTQYLRPDGRVRHVKVGRPLAIAAMAQALEEAGCRLEIEELRTGQVSMTVEGTLPDGDPEEEHTIAIGLCPNGPDVLTTVDTMVTAAHARKFSPANNSGS